MIEEPRDESNYPGFQGLEVIGRRKRDKERIAELEAALKEIAEQQPKTLEMIRSNGFVFESIGNEPGNWQHLAFSIYCDLCEVDMIARNALEEPTPDRRYGTNH